MTLFPQQSKPLLSVVQVFGFSDSSKIQEGKLRNIGWAAQEEDSFYQQYWLALKHRCCFSLSELCRGVFQSLIEKHFPAPDRKKLFSLLGIDLSLQSNNSSPRDSPCKEDKTKKRKGTTEPVSLLF